MAGAPQLHDLISRLRSARSPVERARLLAGSWRALAALTKSERRDLVRGAGLRGLERVVLRLARVEGIGEDEVRAILGRIESLDPAEAGEALRALRDPRRRSDLLRKALAAARSAGHAANARQAIPESLPEPAGRGDDHPRDRPQLPAGPGAQTGHHEGGGPAEDPAGVSGREEPVAGVGSCSTGKSESLSEPIGSPQPASADPAGTARPRRERAAAAVESSGPEQRPWAAGGQEVAQRLDGIPSPVKRLGQLRQILQEKGSLEGHDLRPVLTCFPPGWQRRRALDAILKAGLPPGVDEALDLIGSLPSAWERRWCLSALQSGRVLHRDEVRRIEEMASGRRSSPVRANTTYPS